MSSTDTTSPLIIKHRYPKLVGWLCVAFFTFCAVGAWTTLASLYSLLFLPFVALGGYLILNSGSMQVDADSIRYILPLWRYQIKWNEVQYIEIDRQGGNIVFVGENKKLAVIGPMYWSGKDKLDTVNFMNAQMRRYGIEMRQTEKAMFRLSRNTKY